MAHSHSNEPLEPIPFGNPPLVKVWMIRVLQVAGWYNILAGLAMMTLYHEGFKMLGIAKPELNLPIQLVGLLVGIFGIGYLMVAGKPVQNRNILLLGFLSKLLGPALAFGYIANGMLTTNMVPVLILADLIYLLPFWLIYRRCSVIAQQTNTAMRVEPEQDLSVSRSRAA